MDAPLETLVVAAYVFACSLSIPRPGPAGKVTGAPRGTLLCADAGHRGREHHDSLALIGVELIVPDKHKLGERPPSEIAKARIGLVIESVFSTLKRQMRMEDHLAKTLPGLAQHIAQRLLSLTLDMLTNTIHDRPPRALAPRDRR
jgi:hypothetical protein